MRLRFWPSKQRTQLDDELQSHLQMAARDRIERGERLREATQAARREFGNVSLVREVTREQWGAFWFDALFQDLRYAARMLRKNPGFTFVAVLTLALGIGANTAIFSIVNGVLLEPLPYSHPEQLVAVARTEPRFDHPVPVSAPNFGDWRARATQFESLAAFDGRSFAVLLGTEPEHVLGAAVSWNFFGALQVMPALGRNFLEPEEHGGNDHVVLVTDAFWRQRLGGDPGWIGRPLTINGHAFTVIGVLPSGFRYVMMPRAEIFVPLNLEGQGATRGNNFLSVIGRMKPEVSLRQAQSEMDSIASALAKEYPTDNAEQGAVVIPMLTRVGRWIRDALLILLAAVGLVLLIACANIANLMLAQAVRRRSEIAVRSALGAGAARLARQCLTESVLLGLLGGALGLLAGYWGLHAFRSFSPDNIPRLEEVQINVRVLLFSFGISLLAGILFGLAPAWRISRVNLADTLKEGSTRGSCVAHRGLARQAFVIAEIALSLVLLAGAGLAVRSFIKMTSTDPGYDAHNLLTFYLSPQVGKAAQAADFFHRVTERLSTVPGVASVAMSRSIPPSGGEVDGPVITSKNPDIDPNRAPDIIFNPISPNYFRTMRLPLLAGREFSDADVHGAPLVVIVNEAAARALFPGENAVGQRLKLGVDSLGNWWTIVGIATDERYFGWDSDRTPTAYLPLLQVLQDAMPDYDSAIIIRANGEPLSLLPSVRSAVASVNNQMALLGPQTMEQRLAQTFAPRRFNMTLLASFAGVALLLAAVGIYGVMAQFVAQRTQEIGIRVALGARAADVAGLVIGQGMRLALFGLVIGIGLAVAATRLIHSMLYGVSASDPWSFIAVVVLLLGVVFLACYIPAYRAMRTDPIVALRYE